MTAVEHRQADLDQGHYEYVVRCTWRASDTESSVMVEESPFIALGEQRAVPDVLNWEVSEAVAKLSSLGFNPEVEAIAYALPDSEPGLPPPAYCEVVDRTSPGPGEIWTTGNSVMVTPRAEII